MAVDPICGMQVDPETAPSADRDGETYYFCCVHCRKKFLSGKSPARSEGAQQPADTGDPSHREEQPAASAQESGEPQQGGQRDETASTGSGKYVCPMCEGVESDQPGSCPKCGMALEPSEPQRPQKKTVYTCPMHPEVEQDEPGSCPKCGMELEPQSVTAEEEDSSELRDMSRRFWVSLALTVPVFLLAMLPMVGVPVHDWISRRVSGYVQLVLTTPIMFLAYWPLLLRGVRSVVTWNLNMFTLIGLGTLAAYGYSTFAILLPGMVPDDFKYKGAGDPRWRGTRSSAG